MTHVRKKASGFGNNAMSALLRESQEPHRYLNGRRHMALAVKMALNSNRNKQTNKFARQP